jgi:hypothetical protein
MSDNILDAKLAADQLQPGTKPKAMDQKGSVGKHFTSTCTVSDLARY